MKKRFFLVSVVAVILSLYSLVPFTKPAEAQTGKVTELTFATYFLSVGGAGEDFVVPMCKEIESRTNGKLKFTIHWAQSLVKGVDTVPAIRDGIADMAMAAGSFTPGRFLTTDVGTLPFAAKNPVNVVKAMNALKNKGSFDKEWHEVELLAVSGTGQYTFLFRDKKPMKFEDLAGIRMRSPGGYMTEALKAFGMTPVIVTPGDYFSSYERGLIDGFSHNPNIFVKYKLHEVRSRSVLMANYCMYSNGGIIFNKKKFASFTPDIQQIIRDAANKYAYEYQNTFFNENGAALNTLKESGVEIYEFPESEMIKMRAAGVSVWKKFIADLESKGLPGKQLVADFGAELKKLGEVPPYQE